MPLLYWLFWFRLFNAPFSVQSLGLKKSQEFRNSKAIYRIAANLETWDEDILLTQLDNDFLPQIDQCYELRQRHKLLSAQLTKHQVWLAFIEAFFKKQTMDTKRGEELRKQALKYRDKAAGMNVLPSIWQEWFLLAGVSILLSIGLLHSPFGTDLNEAISAVIKGKPMVIVKTMGAVFLALVIAVITKTFLAGGLSSKDKREARWTLAVGVFFMILETSINYHGMLELFSSSELKLFETRFTALGVSGLGALMNFLWGWIVARRIKNDQATPSIDPPHLKSSTNIKPYPAPSDRPELAKEAHFAYRESIQARTGLPSVADLPKSETELFQEMEALKKYIEAGKTELRKIDLSLKAILQSLHAELGVWFFKYKLLKTLRNLRR